MSRREFLFGSAAAPAVSLARAQDAATRAKLGRIGVMTNDTSWLGLCPTNQQSGKKILNRRTRNVVNRATVAFRNAATTLLRSQSYLGAQYRRLRTRLGAPKAITAMARKLACLFYRLIKHGQPYVDKGTEYYEARYREHQIRSLTKRAQKLGLQVVIPQTARTNDRGFPESDRRSLRERLWRQKLTPLDRLVRIELDSAS
jgi:hypothetical protein